MAKRGAKRRTPTTAVTYLIYKSGKSTYWFQNKLGILNAGTIINSSKRDVRRLSLNFFIKLGKGLHMKWYVVANKLMKLQKRFPPKVHIKDKRSLRKKANN